MMLVVSVFLLTVFLCYIFDAVADEEGHPVRIKEVVNKLDRYERLKQNEK